MRPKHIGNCPWCEAHDVDLVLVTGAMDGRVIAEYICQRCAKALEWWREELRKEQD